MLIHRVIKSVINSQLSHHVVSVSSCVSPLAMPLFVIAGQSYPNENKFNTPNTNKFIQTLLGKKYLNKPTVLGRMVMAIFEESRKQMFHTGEIIN